MGKNDLPVIVNEMGVTVTLYREPGSGGDASQEGHNKIGHSLI